MSQEPDQNPKPSQNKKQLEIIYQDQWLIFVNKPPDLPTQPTVDRKRVNVFDLAKTQLNSKQVYLHHRLDKDTSGVLLLAIHPAINKHLTDMFREHKFTKTYWALTSPSEKIKTDSWEIKNHLIGRRQSPKLVKMFATQSGGDVAHTLFKRLENHPKAWLIEAKPLTGRTHQIRVHLQQSGTPIFGDWLYGSKKLEPEGMPTPRLMLHAQSLEFYHPLLKKQMQIEAPLPEDFKQYLARLKA